MALGMIAGDKVMENDMENKTEIKKLLYFILIPVLIFYGAQFSLGESFSEMPAGLHIVNILFLEFFSFLFLSVIGNSVAVLCIECVSLTVFSIADAYVRQFRGDFIMPWDLLSFKTAFSVAGNYDYVISDGMRRSIISAVMILILIFVQKPDAKIVIKSIKSRAAVGLLSLLLIFSLAAFIQHPVGIAFLDVEDSEFGIKLNPIENGIVGGFIFETKYLLVKKPEGYSASEAKRILDEQAVDYGAVPEELPDILVFMDETFSDPAVLAPFETNIDYMPFMHSLLEGKEDTISGHAHVSVKGGGTANSEFEFLTSHSMAFLPKGSSPYQQYVKKPIDSVVRHLERLGYRSLGAHPFHSANWSRNTAYPNLGFMEYHFNSYFEPLDLKKVRNYVSDEGFMQQTADDVLNMEAPVFSFNVTMQNHSGYGKDFDNLPLSVYVKGTDPASSDSAEKISRYLSLIKTSDEALEKLIERYKKTDRKTMIVFFGDHQTDDEIMQDIYELNGMDYNSLTEEQLWNTYIVPFAIWANFDIEEKTGVETSLNYLMNIALKAAGIPLDAYRMKTDGYSLKYPVITAHHIIDSEGNDLLPKDVGDDLHEYNCLEYYKMFDE